MSTYEERAQTFGFANKQEVLEALKDPATILLDVRSEEEIAEFGKAEGFNWRHSKCTPLACQTLSAIPESILPDKDATIVLYCASGRRAAKAQAILLEKEYKKVLNAGGLNDLLAFLKA